MASSSEKKNVVENKEEGKDDNSLYAKRKDEGKQRLVEQDFHQNGAQQESNPGHLDIVSTSLQSGEIQKQAKITVKEMSDEQQEKEPGLLNTKSKPPLQQETRKSPDLKVGEVQSDDEDDTRTPPTEQYHDAEEVTTVSAVTPVMSGALFPDQWMKYADREDNAAQIPQAEPYYDAQDEGLTEESRRQEELPKNSEKIPQAVVDEVQSSDEDEGEVQIAQLGRVHGSQKSRKASSSPIQDDIRTESSSKLLSPKSDMFSETSEEKIIVSPKRSRGQNEEGEDYHMRILEKHESPPGEDYRLQLIEKDYSRSHDKLVVQMAPQDSVLDRKPSSLPEVVPPMNEKMIAIPGDDMILVPRHDEKIPVDRHDDKMLSPQGIATIYTRNELQLDSNQADEKAAPIYIDPEDNTNGGDYFVGKVNDLTGRNSIDGCVPLKVGVDGSILIPQPSDDPNDPLNWSWTKKHSTFWALLVCSLFSDWVIFYGTPLYSDQAYEWQQPIRLISRSISAATIMQGIGGLVMAPLTQRFGRVPLLFWSQFFTLIATVGAVYVKTYNGFSLFRALQGFFAAAPQIVGLSIIHDISFFHERARYINTWLFLTLLGPYLGAFTAGMIVERISWRDTFAVLCGFYGFSFIVVVFFAEETLYNARNPWPKSGGVIERMMFLTGFIGGMQKQGRPTVWQSIKHVAAVILRPYILVPGKSLFTILNDSDLTSHIAFGFVTLMAMWAFVTINTVPQLMKSPPYYFSNQNTAFLYFAPMVGISLAEIWAHWFNDFLCNRYIQKYGGRFKPEHRLWAVYPSWLLGILGLVLLGQSFQQRMQWGAIAIAWGFVAFSTLGTGVAIVTYFLDVLPFYSAATAAWLLFFRSMGRCFKNILPIDLVDC